MKDHPPRRRRTLVAALLTVLLVVVAGCTGSEAPPREEAAPSAPAAPSELPSRSVEAAPTLEPRSVPTEVRVARVVGSKLAKPRRRQLERQVARVLSDYFDTAYLGGDYPRAEFPRAFATFSRGAARRARTDRALLSNARSGQRTETVVPRVKSAALDVLVPHQVVAGLTARVRLVFVEERAGGRDQRVTVKGRLMMNRRKSGPWQIFGYDVSRSAVPAARGGGR